VAALTDIVSIRSLLQPILVERQVGTEEHKKVANVCLEITILCYSFVLST